jgi:hypothetical protein
MGGNPHWFNYMDAAGMICKNPRTKLGEASLLESAMYGAICGDYDAMMTVCNASYYDQLWAGSKTILI